MPAAGSQTNFQMIFTQTEGSNQAAVGEYVAVFSNKPNALVTSIVDKQRLRPDHRNTRRLASP